MEMLGNLLSILAGIASLVCLILVVVAIFQHGQTTLGILSLVLLLCCGIGGLMLFVYGWMRSSKWGLKNIMTVWTIAILIEIAGIILNPALVRGLQQQLPFGH
jgi:hypothetical protein